MSNATFGKAYKLCSKKLISEVITNGERVKAYPLAGTFLKSELVKDTSFQVLISVPKRSFKLAVHRNRIKRQIREAIRLNKNIIEEYLASKNERWAISVVYRQNETLEFSLLERKVKKLFFKMIEQAQND